MSAWEYEALDDRGRPRNGTLAAASEREAREHLVRRRLWPLRLSPTTTPAAGLRGRFGARELALATRQLATLAAVAPMEEALRTIGTQSERPGTRRVLLSTQAAVVEGFRLSEAMARQGKAFPPLYRAMVAAGESTGALPDILERLADLLERQQEVRGRLVATLVYPMVLAVTAVAVVIALMTFVVPRVVEQFDSMGRALPWLTRAVIAVSDAMTTWGVVFAAVLLLAGVAALHVLRRPGPRLRFDGALLRTPILGRMLRDLHAARLSRTLAIMLAGGLPLMEGLRITARTVGNRVLRDATDGMADAIREGASLSTAMRRAGVFPPTLLYMAASGEDSGRLAPMLERAADYLEREFNTFTSAAMSLLEPAIIIVMGAAVAVIVLSILLPILQFNSLVVG
ncbi:type II secretion system inner membrane protein GspF [Luteimonas sp. MHLX1A]|uniref:type II secretion system inner membrane protein GspF n=1 Tax=Alterluteimonas muca TaxID=2878684 RepID=UPI000C23A9F1|nr:type II secretion system inner membrane protein GspF [Luteimonas sp. MHLX1A]PJK00969.1 type II secretion system protein GspF [Xanthomonadaceae bacterium NML91-0213]